MKVRILKSVTIGGQIHAKGTTPDVDVKTAKLLIDGEFATEHIESPVQQPPVRPVREQLLAQFAKASKKELAVWKAGAEKVLSEEPGREDAKLIIEVADELAKTAK